MSSQLLAGIRVLDFSRIIGGPFCSQIPGDMGAEVIKAVGGLMGITGEPNGPPVKVGVAMTDIGTALYAHRAILAALHARHRSRVGQRIDVALLETQIAALINIASSFLNGGEVPRKWGTAHGNIVPYQAFRTQDGYMIIGAGNDRLWTKLCRALDLPCLERIRNSPRIPSACHTEKRSCAYWKRA